jgi:hypothetical protein
LRPRRSVVIPQRRPLVTSWWLRIVRRIPHRGSAQRARTSSASGRRSDAVTAPVVDVVEQGGRSAEGRTDTRASLGPVPMHDSRRGEDLPAVGIVKHAGRSEGRTGAHVPCESQSEDTAPVAPVEDSRAGGRDDLQVEQERVGTTFPPAEVKEYGSRSGSGPRRVKVGVGLQSCAARHPVCLSLFPFGFLLIELFVGV